MASSYASDREYARFPLLSRTARRFEEHDGSDSGGDDDAEALAKQASKEQESKSSWYLFLLTLSIGGLQIVWSVELSNGSPYLLSLGMSKSLLAFVWIAGPLTGTLVQPYVGIRSDNCRIHWGKRKPFMVGGGIATILSLLALAWVREIVGGFLGIFGASPQSKGVKISTIVLATVLMYCLDFAINTVQAAIRAFIVDNAPAHQQESANAWASRLTGIGNILGYISGYLDLPKHLPFLGNTQFKVLCVIASFSLGATLLVSCLYIKERDPRLEGPPQTDNPGIISFFVQVFESIRRLPPQVRKVCEIQLCAWVGWFPFLFYSTTYIGQLYVNPIFDGHPDMPKDEIEDAWETATRIGTFALLAYAVVSFVASIVLPLLVVPTYRAPPVGDDSYGAEATSTAPPPRPNHPYVSGRQSTSTLAFTPSTGSHLNQQDIEASYHTSTTATTASTRSPLLRMNLLSKLQVPGLTLRRMWLLSHLLFTLCMFSTFFVYSAKAGIVVIAIVGVSWALTLWAPFALISAEVAQRDAEHRHRKRRCHHRRRQRLRGQTGSGVVGSSSASDGHSWSQTEDCGTSSADANTKDDDDAGTSFASSSNHKSKDSETDEEAEEGDSDEQDSAEDNPEEAHHDEDDDPDEVVDQAGIILGIHNVAISCPQVISTLISSVIFRALQKPRGEPWDDSVGWVLRFGGCAALGAAWFTRRLADGSGGKMLAGSAGCCVGYVVYAAWSLGFGRLAYGRMGSIT